MTFVRVFSLFFIFILILLIIVFSIGIYFIVYKRHINRALHDEKRIHRRMPSFGFAAVVLCVIVLILCITTAFGQIRNLNEQIINSNNMMNSQINDMSQEIQSFYDLIKKENSLITSVEYSFGEFDAEEHKVKVIITVAPKMVSADAKLSIRVGNEVVELNERVGGEFRGSFVIDIFEEYESCILTIIQGSEQKTERIEEMELYQIWYKFMPDLFAYYGYSDENYFKGKYNLKMLLHLVANSSAYDSDYGFTNIHLVTEINGELIDDRAIVENNSLTVKKEILEDINLDESYEMKESDRIDIYVTAEDNMGYSYKYSVYSQLANGSMGFETDNLWIYDKNGNLMN